MKDNWHDNLLPPKQPSQLKAKPSLWVSKTLPVPWLWKSDLQCILPPSRRLLALTNTGFVYSEAKLRGAEESKRDILYRKCASFHHIYSIKSQHYGSLGNSPLGKQTCTMVMTKTRHFLFCFFFSFFKAVPYPLKSLGLYLWLTGRQYLYQWGKC